MATMLQNGHFYGLAVDPLRVGDVLLAETTYAGDAVVPLHAHAHPFFCVPLEGTFVEHLDRTRRILRPRSALYHPSGYDHAETFEHGPARLFNIQMGGEWLSRLEAFDIRLPAEHIALPHGRVPALALQINDEYRHGGERLVVDGLLLVMLGELMKWRRTRERNGVPGWMNDVVAALHASSPAGIGLAELAGIARVHPSHLARTFRAVHGCTIGDYARELRVQRARELLARSALPLARIALQCGFADQSHFTRAFRRTVGVTPAAYRRTARSE